jgi:glutathione S-transferase
MKLYHFPVGPSLAARIALREAGLEAETIEVDFAMRTAGDGRPFAEISPKGYVPALVLDDGAVLTENVAILDWIAQQSPALRPADAMERSRLIEMLAFLSTEIHKPFLSLLFMPGEEAKPLLREIISSRFAFLGEGLKADYLLGDRFSTADAMLYVMLSGERLPGIEVPEIFDAYVRRIGARPAVREALAA